MNPAPFIPGVEIIPGPNTTEDVATSVIDLIREVGKHPVRVSDSAGFISNRLQFALYAEAARIVEEGLATPAEVDETVANCFGFRLAFFGLFEIGDMAGLDVYAGSYETLSEDFGERFAGPKLLGKSVARGNLGLQTGRGLRDIDENEAQALVEYRTRAYAGLSRLKTSLGPPPAFQ